MSAPVTAEMLRELHATIRTFRSVRSALLWYQGQLEARLRVNRDPSDSGLLRMSKEKREEAQATFAAIANCLKPIHPTDPEDEDEALGIRYRLSGEMLCWLAAWYDSGGWGDGEWLAQKANMNRWAFARRCKKTERALRTRLEYAGLLEEEQR